MSLLRFIDLGRTKRVFIDVEYEDKPNKYKREERLELSAEEARTPSDVRIRIALLDPKQRKFKYRLTFVGTAGEISRGQLIESEETLLTIREPA